MSEPGSSAWAIIYLPVLSSVKQSLSLISQGGSGTTDLPYLSGALHTHTDTRTQTHTVTLGELHRAREKDANRPAVSRGSVHPAHPLHLHQQLALRWVQLNCAIVALRICCCFFVFIQMTMCPLVYVIFIFFCVCSLFFPPVSCCLRYNPNPPPCKRILTYSFQTIGASCDINAVV